MGIVKATIIAFLVGEALIVQLENNLHKSIGSKLFI